MTIESRSLGCFTEKTKTQLAATMNHNDLHHVDMNLLVFFETLMFEKT
jgi:hypothetical protein